MHATNNKRCSSDIVQIHSPVVVAQIRTARYRSLFSYRSPLNGPIPIAEFHRSYAEKAQSIILL